MEPEDFIAKWRDCELTERAASQSHFNELCELLGVDKPVDADRKGTTYTFDKALKKPDGAQGFADVWKKGCFAWEYKGNSRNLVHAYTQLKQYADALANPPLLIVSDMKEIRVHTNFNSEVAEELQFKIIDFRDPLVRAKLRSIWTDPDSWRPTKTRKKVTEEAALKFADIAYKLRRRGHDPRRVAHFLNRIVFCLFAEDEKIALLPERVFADILEEAAAHSDKLDGMLRDLFRAMKDKGGRFGTQSIPWFNGGLFDDDDVLEVHAFDIPLIVDAARLDWSAIDPFIFGTLFEKGLDPDRRKEMASQFDIAEETERPRLFKDKHDKGVGIHYTDPDTIQKLIEPVILRPWRADWEQTKAAIAELREKKKAAKSDAARTRIEAEIRAAYLDFRTRLGRFRVLDPACGSGNFLYLSLLQFKDFDRLVLTEARELGLPADHERVTPDCVLGIEVNPYAAELARVTVWIAEIQWQIRNYGPLNRSPILGRLDGIGQGDALLSRDHKRETKWPEADVVIGNPPFLGDRKIVPMLGQPYADSLREVFRDRVPGGADLVCYWFEKSRALIEAGKLARAGLVATNSIRGGANRKVLDRICESGRIFEAWSDEPWVLNGAAVRVSLVAFSGKSRGEPNGAILDGNRVAEIHSDLTAEKADVTKAKCLEENEGVAFQGTISYGPFEVSGSEARGLIAKPLNPNGRMNADVVRLWTNGKDITGRPQDFWIIFFPDGSSAAEAALYEAPFKIVEERVRPYRATKDNPDLNKNWWRLWRSRPELLEALQSVKRQIVTPRVAKHRLFVWRPTSVVPDSATVAIARDDDATFGILHSRFHELWTLRLCTWLGVGNDPRYTPSTTFETFPFPKGLTPNIPAAKYANDPRAKKIAETAKRLNELRENWLNPEDLVRREPEVVPGYPDRVLPRTAKAADILKKRTLTNLYNERPTWLINAHAELDAAVAAAYGWPADLSDDDVLSRLFALNQERAAGNAVKAEAASALAAPKKKIARKNAKRATE